MSKKDFMEVTRAFACWFFAIFVLTLISVSITFAVEVIRYASGIDTTKIMFFLMGMITCEIVGSLSNE